MVSEKKHDGNFLMDRYPLCAVQFKSINGAKELLLLLGINEIIDQSWLW